jgi:beta-aspartyl-peptidase (threonine type)
LNYSLVVHGGAGIWKGARRRKGLRGVRRAASNGLDILRRGEVALDAVESCVITMEDDSTFNAGYGSALNLLGQVEMDASIMDGQTLQAGAVALVKRVKNPIRLARLVMEKTDHVLIAARGAERLARMFRLESINPVTHRAKSSWRLLRAQLARGEVAYLPKTSRLLHELPEVMSAGTVGAVARDRDGNIAAATSTGGLALRLPGRIGDTPLIGSGTYADELGGCSVTGIGEGAIRLALAKTGCDLIQRGLSPQKAAEQSVWHLQRRLGMKIGMIAIDARGRIGSAHSTPDLCWAFVKSSMRAPRAALK